jgi:hypothetical protein
MNRLGVLSLRGIACALTGISALVGFSTSGHALATVANNYCSAGTNTQIVSDTVSGNLLAVGDVTLSIGSPTPTNYTSSDCYGGFDPGAQNPANETIALNDIFGGISDPNKLYYLDATGSSDPAPSAIGLSGITFVIGTTGGLGGAQGNWTLTWSDSNGAIGANLPIYVDLVVLLMGGNNNAAYLLSNILLPVSPNTGTGTFDIQFLNRGGQQPDISHMLVAGRIASTPTITQVPEPSSLAMFAAGLVGLLLYRRSRSA